jgi:hypothetical protein
MSQGNPRILHRIYFKNFAPFYDPYEHYLESWRREMPHYTIMNWNIENLDVYENKWTRTAYKHSAPVFLSEYFRWHVLDKYGGIYLDADCELLNGKVLHEQIEMLYAQTEYDVFFGVEERSNGHPTAQTVAAKKGADLVRFMKRLYEKSLPPLWPWREQRGLIGPQLMSLYFLRHNVNVADNGFFKNLDHPVVSCRAKVYPQKYFSPKFTLVGETLDFEEGATCVYHLFANANVDFSNNTKHQTTRNKALTFNEYRAALERSSTFPRIFDSSQLHSVVGQHTDHGITATGVDGIVLYGPYITLPKGRYIARIKCKSMPHTGVVRLAAIENFGASCLATRSYIPALHSESIFSLPFVVSADSSTNFEVTLSIQGVESIEIEGVEIDIDAGEISLGPPKQSLKLLHRIYFGFDGKPDQFKAYLETWQQQLPDFRILHWNASNLPMDINAYVRDLYIERDHAFLTDFFRWYVLREFGGAYLDADVEIVNGNIFRTLIEQLEESPVCDAFIGIDEKAGGWYTAHSMASKPGSRLATFMCDVYGNFGAFKVWRKKGLYFWAPQVTALYFASHNHNLDGMGTSPGLTAPIDVAGVRIFPQDWFSPLAPSGNANEPFVLSGLSRNTCLCHHFACSWHSADSAYLSYSKEKGGQASALLKDIVDRYRVQRFSATSSSLNTGVGVKGDGGIATTGTTGVLLYGPYISLTVGDYEVSYILDDIASLSDVKVDVVAQFGEILIIDQAITLQDVRNNAVHLTFSLMQDCNNVEFRIFVDEKSEFSLKEVVVTRQ